MNRSRLAAALTLCFLWSSVQYLTADVKTEEKGLVKFEGTLGRVVNLFGGRSAREGVKSTVAVKGDRKATLNDASGQIIDLNEEKIYDLDLRKKTYKVTTFAEVRRQMEEAQRKAAEEVGTAQPQATASPALDPNQKELEVDFAVKETGEKKAINGFNTSQVIMTIALREKGKTLEDGGGIVLTADTWLVPAITAMREVAQFDMRYAQKLQGPMMSGASPEQMASALAMYPGLKDGLARMRAEGAKMDGTPILTTLSVESVKSAAQLAAEQGSAGEASSAKPATVGALLGGLARRRAAKRDEAPAGPSARATFMTTTNEVLSVATTVDPTDLAVPAGFKEAR